MCGLGCMVERENEYDNASELDLSANSSPLKLKGKRVDAPFRLTARPFEQRPNSQLSTGVGMQQEWQGSQLYGSSAYSPYNQGAHLSHPRFMDCPKGDDGNPVGGESVVTVINLRRAHSPHGGLQQQAERPMTRQDSEPNCFNSRVAPNATNYTTGGRPSSRSPSPKSAKILPNSARPHYLDAGSKQQSIGSAHCDTQQFTARTKNSGKVNGQSKKGINLQQSQISPYPQSGSRNC